MSLSIDDGTVGQDDFVGGETNDHFHAGDGNNNLNGGEGNDGLDAGAGNDVVSGELGDDILLGGIGDDNLNGGDGDDQLDGGPGNDVLIGELGDDILHASEGNDDLTGGEDNDQFSFSGPGNFIVQDFDASADLLVFESESTGINNMDDLNSLIDSFEDTDQGVVVHFIDDSATITLVGLQSNELTSDMVGFSSGV